MHRYYILINILCFHLFVCVLLDHPFPTRRSLLTPTPPPFTRGLTNRLNTINRVFGGIFTVEAIVKIVALGPLGYFKDPLNRFD